MKADENLPDTLPPHMEDLRGGRCQVKVPSALSPLSPQRKLMPGPARIPGILFPLLPLYPPLGPAGPNLSAGRADVAAGGATASRWVLIQHNFLKKKKLSSIHISFFFQKVVKVGLEVPTT